MSLATRERRESITAALHEATSRPDDGGPDAAALLDSSYPGSAWQGWIVGQMAVTMRRIDRMDRVEQAIRHREALRAIDSWADDRRLRAEEIARGLARSPGRTVLKLRQTPAGLDWLAARWAELARTESAGWTDEQATLARRLASDDPTADPTADGFVADRLAEIDSRRGAAEEADALLRDMTIAGLNDDIAPLVAVRREARALDRRLRWLVAHRHDDPTPAAPEAAIPTPTPDIEPRGTKPTPPPAPPAPAPAQHAPVPGGTNPTGPQPTPVPSPLTPAQVADTARLQAIIAERIGSMRF